MNHLTEEQLLALADGGIAPNRESPLRSHLHGCAECRTSLDGLQQLLTDLATQDDLDEDAHVHGIMTRLSEGRASSKRASRSTSSAARRSWLVPVAAALAMAATILLVLRSRETARQDEFSARGATSEPTLSRNVGIRIYSSTSRLDALERGSVVAPDASFTGAYRNVHPKPAFLMLFAVDASHTVHWIYPAYTRADENPASIAIERSEREQLFPTSVVLDTPAEGPLRIVTIVSEQPLHVQEIEKLKPEELQHARLEQRFRSSVSETVVEVRK